MDRLRDQWPITIFISHVLQRGDGSTQYQGGGRKSEGGRIAAAAVGGGRSLFSLAPCFSAGMEAVKFEILNLLGLTNTFMRNIKTLLVTVGPGIAVAATGVGAGDMVTAAVAGAKFGTVVLWAAVFGAAIKFALNEGVARWQLGSGSTLLEGWNSHLGRAVSYVFLIYLICWSFIVGGALMSACGLAAHALWPVLSVNQWGAVHSILAIGLVLVGQYSLFENMMKVFIGLMFAMILICAGLTQPDLAEIVPSLIIPSVPQDSGKFLLGIIGGVGGSVTLLNYSYWIKERGWQGKEAQGFVKTDLLTAYILTGIFGIAIMVIAAGVDAEAISGKDMVIALAERLGEYVGPVGMWLFKIGFWGAVFSSMLGVWQGIPYMFADFMRVTAKNSSTSSNTVEPTRSKYYRMFLAFIGLVPMLLFYFDNPVYIVITYAIFGALFMPFLAGTLLYLNNRQDLVGSLKNRWYLNLLLGASLAIFGYLCYTEIASRLKDLF